MRKMILVAVIVVLVSGMSSDSAGSGRQHYDFSAVDRFIAGHLSDYKGNVVVLVSQQGRVIYRKEIGFNASTRKLVASASKWLSGAVVMSLVDDGKISLNDTVGKYLPVFSRYRKGHITIRQLFSHTSGFPGNSPEKYEFRKDLTLAQAVDSFAVHTAMIHAPGEAFNYGGVSMAIAGRIAEVVSGKSWQALCDERIAGPLGIRAAYLVPHPRNPMVAGGLHTSAREYLNFLEMIVNRGMFDNKKLLSQNAVAEMLKDQTGGAVIEGTPYPHNPFSSHPGRSVRYGIGNWLDVTDDAGNAIETSSPGFFGTHPWQDTEQHIAGIIFTMTEPKLSNLTSLKIRQMIREIVRRET